jgi:hypothetical protein
VGRLLCTDGESIALLARADPGEAMARLREHMQAVAALSDQDRLTMQAWKELREKQIADRFVSDYSACSLPL